MELKNVKEKPTKPDRKDKSKTAPESLPDSIKRAGDESKKRNFPQTWDFSMSLSGLDLKRPENRLNLELILPEGRGKKTKVVVIADSLAADARKCADLVIAKDEIEPLAKDKKKLKKLAKEYDWFIAEAPLMPLIGKTLGVVLGPRGRMPKPVPPKVKIEPIVASVRKSIRVVLKDNPVIHAPVGIETMAPDAVAKNAQAVFNLVRDKLPKGLINIKAVYIKLTMGKPVKVEMK